MTTQSNNIVGTSPRLIVRTFWVLHRAINRLGGGRVGLTRPRAGKRFGMMRLDTIGRRSGECRSAIVGYFEDGPNLITLAMNGWAEADPAWWLNLQDRPEASVWLSDGRRTVRARAATGSERQRLWARFDDYPGWGDDLDALAAQRSRQTTVVVLEPRTSSDATTSDRHTSTPSESR